MPRDKHDSAYRDEKGELRSPELTSPNPVSHPHMLNPDRTATEGEPQRGDPDNPEGDLPEVEHVEGDVSTRVNQGLPPEKTQAEKDAEAAGHTDQDGNTDKDAVQHATVAHSESERRRLEAGKAAKAKEPDPSLRKSK